VERLAAKASPEGSSLMGLAGSCAVLLALVSLAALGSAWLAHGRLSPLALQHALLGGGVCWLAATLALAVTYAGTRHHAPVQAVLIAMLLRMGLPLAALVLIARYVEDSGAGLTLLGAYFVALIAETALSLRMVTRAAPAKNAASPGSAA